MKAVVATVRMIVEEEEITREDSIREIVSLLPEKVIVEMREEDLLPDHRLHQVAVHPDVVVIIIIEEDPIPEIAEDLTIIVTINQLLSKIVAK